MLISFYVGCSGSFDDRGKKISVAFAKILQEAGVSFGILGTEEGCCGDSAMRCGTNISHRRPDQHRADEWLRREKSSLFVRTAITRLKDYPNFGGNFEVYHHTEIIAKLIAEGKIVCPSPEGHLRLSRFLLSKPPRSRFRQILKSIRGIDVVEMERTLDKSFCCGRRCRMWMQETLVSINNARTKQAIDAGADTIAVGCPLPDDDVRRLRTTTKRSCRPVIWPNWLSRRWAEDVTPSADTWQCKQAIGGWL